MKKIAVMIDGGFVRTLARRAAKTYDPDLVEGLSLRCKCPDEDIQRVLYYDCAPYAGIATLPVSGNEYTFEGSDQWLDQLARKNLFAVRLGVLKFRGWLPKKIPLRASAASLEDSDFRPDFEQKGVDMRIGLDMATYAANRAVELIAVATNDTDCIPAMKYARRAGLQVALVCLPNCAPARELLAHCDFLRRPGWP